MWVSQPWPQYWQCQARPHTSHFTPHGTPILFPDTARVAVITPRMFWVSDMLLLWLRQCRGKVISDPGPGARYDLMMLWCQARRCDHFSPVAEWSVKCPPTSSACVSTRGVFQVRMIMSPVTIGNNVWCQDLEVVTRECGPASDVLLPAPGCRTRQLGGGAAATICACAGDLCNMVTAGAPGAGVNTSLVTMLMMLSALLGPWHNPYLIKFSRGDFRPEKASPVSTLSAVLTQCLWWCHIRSENQKRSWQIKCAKYFRILSQRLTPCLSSSAPCSGPPMLLAEFLSQTWSRENSTKDSNAILHVVFRRRALAFTVTSSGCGSILV